MTSDWAVQVIEYAKHFKYLIVGGDSLGTDKMIRRIADNEVGAVMAILWYSQGVGNQEFSVQAQQLWGNSVNWHTALAYDATRAVLTALEKLPSPNRVNLRQVMANPNFKATGATGTITFEKDGDRQESTIHLVKVVRNPTTGKPELIPLVKSQPKID